MHSQTVAAPPLLMAACERGNLRRMDRRELHHAMWHDVDSGWALSAEFLSAIFVWFGIGWLLDRWLGTGPWLMGIGTMLGLALGMWLLWLRNQHATEEERDRFRYREQPKRSTPEVTPEVTPGSDAGE